MFILKSILLAGTILLIFTACSSSLRFTSIVGEDIVDSDKSLEQSKDLKAEPDFKTHEKIRGIASYYADKFHGRKTSSGEIYNKNFFTAAHRTLPFGTKVKVTNLKNSREVIVIINDRGPMITKRVIDLSRAAAEQIDMIYDGIVEVEIEIIE